jgi:hypothetical protein
MGVATCAGVRWYVDSLLSFSSAIYLEWTSERAGKVLALGERIGEMRIVERMLMTGMDSWAGLFCTFTCFDIAELWLSAMGA